MSYITNAIGGISDEHIAEFAFAKPKKIYTGVLMKITAAAACAAVIVTGIPWVGRKISSLPMFSVSSNIITDCWADPDNENNARVVFNGITYLFDNEDMSRTPDQLREEFEYVGDVLTIDLESSETDGFSLGCSVGDPIYMDPEFTGEIYVFTNSLSRDAKYVRFTEYTAHEAFEEMYQLLPKIYGELLFDNRLYFCIEDDHYDELSDRCLLIDIVLPDCITDPAVGTIFFNSENKAYQDPDHPGEIYIYESNHSGKEYYYRRYLDFEACRQEGKLQRGILRKFLDVIYPTNKINITSR